MQYEDFLSIESDVDFYSKLFSTNCFLPVLQHMGILIKNKICDKCQKSMKININLEEEKSYFRCLSYKCNKNKVTIKKYSILEKKNIKFKTFIILIYGWVQNHALQQQINNTKLSKKTIIYWHKIFREMVAKNRKKNFKKIGGVEKTVKIDESVINKRKYNKGRIVKTKWILGGIFMEDGNLFFSNYLIEKWKLLKMK
ncbi:hypothetical protein SLOPH_2604 [Spraguea lophii 42_110]|uniref:ISXO2-like transposase domain-containing protein n=1 Tax=Spraguea lophii (strain 42_110) TaxID=1358809 RepID=S7W993_SPRLO|nr:hypothetical protein SLOPH_2604 [Spraguea lophii 42_110]